MTDQEREQQIIQGQLAKDGLSAQEWRDGDDGREAFIGRYRVAEDDEDAGLFQNDEGDLTACVVGAAEHFNERVYYAFVAEGTEGGVEVRDLSMVDSV